MLMWLCSKRGARAEGTIYIQTAAHLREVGQSAVGKAEGDPLALDILLPHACNHLRDVDERPLQRQTRDHQFVSRLSNMTTQTKIHCSLSLGDTDMMTLHESIASCAIWPSPWSPPSPCAPRCWCRAGRPAHTARRHRAPCSAPDSPAGSAGRHLLSDCVATASRGDAVTLLHI